jgi:hypothetical protein
LLEPIQLQDHLVTIKPRLHRGKREQSDVAQGAAVEQRGANDMALPGEKPIGEAR